MNSTPTAVGRAFAERFDSAESSGLLAGVDAETLGTESAFQRVCLSHWYPVYAFLRRKGVKPEEAASLAGMFFREQMLLGKASVGAASRHRRLRIWLLNSLQNFLLKQLDRARPQEAGEGDTHPFVASKEAEVRYLLEHRHDATPERTFDRVWAMELLDQALRRLRKAYVERNEAAFFEQLKLYSPGKLVPPAYEVVARRLGKRVPAVKVAVTLFRKNVGEALREEIMATVEDPAEVEDELHCLVLALSD